MGVRLEGFGLARQVPAPRKERFVCEFPLYDILSLDGLYLADRFMKQERDLR
jgi:hypothetical protein